jgi:hypothetical protein
MDLPKLPRQPIRPEREPDAEQEIWFPNWWCFCCHDNGYVQRSGVLLIIPDYNWRHDKLVRCQNPRCEAGKDYAGNPQYDQRFTAGICVDLDKIERSHWKNYVLDARSAAKAASAIAKLTNAKGRSKPRTENDEREIQQRKAEIEAITHEQWIDQGQQYFWGNLNEFE